MRRVTCRVVSIAASTGRMWVNWAGTESTDGVNSGVTTPLRRRDEHATAASVIAAHLGTLASLPCSRVTG